MTAASVRSPPPLAKIPDFPVSGGLAVLAVLVTVMSWTGAASIEPLAMSAAAFHGEPWRLITSALPHGGLFHLAFNLYWVWLFGTLLEERLGAAVSGGLIALMAAGSATVEYTLFYGGIGLSGVVYGLFGMLLVLKARDPRFLGTLDQRTVNLLGAWFFIAIGLHYAGIMRIANGAHAGGWAVGAALGLLVAAKRAQPRVLALALNLAWIVGLWLAATVGLPVLNLNDAGDRDWIHRAATAAAEGELVESLELYEKVADYGPTKRDLWEAIAQDWESLGETERAKEAWARSGRVPDSRPD